MTINIGTQISDMTDSATDFPDGAFVPFVVEEATGGLSPSRNYRFNAGRYLAKLSLLASSAGAGLVGLLQGGTVQDAIQYLTPEMFGFSPDDSLPERTAAFVAFAEATVDLGMDWVIPYGDYSISPVAPIDFTTGGTCYGTIIFPRSNTEATIRFVRDAPGSVVDCSGWTMTRGTIDVGATNAENMIVYLASPEILIERKDAAPYTRQELIKVLDNGTLSRPLSCTYSAPASVTATAYAESRPVVVVGLRVSVTGAGGGATLGTIRVERDNMRFESLELTASGDLNPASGVEVGVSVYNCYNPTFTNPAISGFTKDGLGYGIIFSGTLCYVVQDGQIFDCRHAITGCYNADGLIRGGSYHKNIDDHWADNWRIEGVDIRTDTGNAGILYAGFNLTVVDPVQYNGRTMVSIRQDTPNLGGVVEIIRPRFYSEGEASDIYGFLSLVEPWDGPFTDPPVMPDKVLIESPVLDAETGTNRWAVYVGEFEAEHVNWGTIRLQGGADFGGDNTTAVFYHKDSTYQTVRSTTIEVDGGYNCAAGAVVFVLTTDTDNTRGANIYLTGCTGAVRCSPDGVITGTFDNCTLTNLNCDGAAADFASNNLFMVRNCTFPGGAISITWRQIGFFNCQFTGTISTFPLTDPSTSLATLVSCVKSVAQPNLPTNITDNMVTPFSA